MFEVRLKAWKAKFGQAASAAKTEKKKRKREQLNKVTCEQEAGVTWQIELFPDPRSDLAAFSGCRRLTHMQRKQGSAKNGPEHLWSGAQKTPLVHRDGL